MRQSELNQAISALVEQQSLLILGEEGSGKSALGKNVAQAMEDRGYLVAIASYTGSAKKMLVEIAEQLGIDTLRQTVSGKFVPLTADELRVAIEPILTAVVSDRANKPILICDDAHRYPQSMRFWLQDAIGQGAIMLLLATKPPRKDIFLKMPRIALQPLQVDEIRSLMLAEANVLGVNLDVSKLAELQERSGGNPYLAKRVVREEVLGIGDGEEGDHVEYIDGTPFLIAAISLVAILRFVGLGLGDRSLYIIGGIATVLAITLRVALLRANSRSGSKL